MELKLHGIKKGLHIWPEIYPSILETCPFQKIPTEVKIELQNELPKPVQPVPPKLIEPNNHDTGHDHNFNNEIDCPSPVDFNRDVSLLFASM